MTDTDLIRRLEEATEGSRELDAEFWALDAAIEAPLTFGHELQGSIARAWVKCGSIGAWLDCIPQYTGDLDAAARLIPSGKRLRVLELAIARCMARRGFEDDDWIAYLARAVCIEALRARDPNMET